jgi:hypothetical protein
MQRLISLLPWPALAAGIWLALASCVVAGPPPNVQVNQSDNNTGTNDNSTTQSETCHAVFGQTVVVGFNDSRQGVNGFANITSLQSFAYSQDGGGTFTDAGQFTPAANTVHYGDPAVAVDSQGNFYMASLAGASPFGSGITQLAVAKSTATNPAVTFGTPVLLSGQFTGLTANQDKEFMAIDTSGGPFNDRVYVAWTNFQDNSTGTSRILLARSTSNSPLAFAPTIAINPVADETTCLLNHGAMPAVGPNGEVYVVWARFGWSPGVTSSSIRVVKSTDGGVSFHNPDPGDPAPNKTVANPNVTPQSMNSGGVNVRTRDFPYIAVDRTPSGSPTRGHVYIVFQARPQPAGTDRSDIFFTRSTDGGRTWSTPRSINAWPAVTVNPDTTTNDNWQPSLSVSPTNGQLSVTFYDRRSDPANTQIALFRAVSTDFGLTWFNEQISTGTFTPDTGYDPILVSTYMGDYIWSVADGANFHYSWGDCRNLCMPPMGSPNPPTPTGRSDQDVFYAKTAILSGPDLFITPWGAITGIGPLWKSPDIFVVDATNNEINAAKGQVNRLRARVSNIGNAPAMGVVIRFRYAPCFAGLTDAALKEIGTVMLDFAAAGDMSGNDLKIVPINWDLTNLMDTNGGLWPMPISAFDHFCVRVNVEFAADINQSNNSAQTNFFDVPTLTGNSLLAFMVGNPLEKEVEAELIADLPRGFKAELLEFPAKFGEKFVLKPREIKVARIQFSPPEQPPRPVTDLVAHVTFRVAGKEVGGLSARLAQAEKRSERVIAKDFDTVWKAALEVLKEKQEPVALADPKRGIINTRSINADNRRLRTIVDRAEQRVGPNQDGRYVLTIEVKKAEDKMRVVVKPVIIVTSAADNPLGGLPVPSNGTLEAEHLDAIVKKVGGG